MASGFLYLWPAEQIEERYLGGCAFELGQRFARGGVRGCGLWLCDLVEQIRAGPIAPPARGCGRVIGNVAVAKTMTQGRHGVNG